MKKKVLYSIICLLLIVCITGGLFYNGIIWFNNPSMEKYPVRGVDVSSYQGEIDWNVLASQNISFAYLKATEGSSYLDPYFLKNYEAAIKTDLRVGAYHFFSFESSGTTQAANFITTVPKTATMLPPVVDIEFYGDNEHNPPEKGLVQRNLNELLAELEAYYGIKPIIYATQKSYKQYIRGSYTEYDLWIRDVYTAATLQDGREWSFRQYSNREKLDGYDGEEKYIDMNVFNGTKEEFEAYGK